MSASYSKVLIADDFKCCSPADLQRPIRRLLYSIVHAFDGLECLNALDDGVDLAFIDVHMPTMGGMDAVWAARIAGNKTFVTLMSGQADRRCIALARQLGAYEFLTKPFSAADIGTILATHRRVSMPMQVLLVDDSPVTLNVMRKVLASSVFHLNIEVANTGAEALARCNAETFDVVFLDVNMPGLNGYATLARLRQANPQTKVVMISGEYNTQREREALRLGAAAVMHKPFFPTEIDAVLHRIFGLQSPKLATDAFVSDFGIRIYGRTIVVEHAESGHVYEYVWFRHPPYLRLPLIRATNWRRFRSANFRRMRRGRPCMNWKMPGCWISVGPPSPPGRWFGELPRFEKNGPAEAGPSDIILNFTCRSVANPPAPVRVANTMPAPTTAGAGRHHDWRSNHYAWRCYDGRSAIVHATVVTIATAAAVRTTMKAESTATGDRNCQPGLCLFERRKRHGLGGGNAEDADADGHCEGKKFVHSFLLCFVTYILRPRRARMQHSHRAHESSDARIHGRRKLSQICWPVKNARKFRDSFSERLSDSVSSA